jgi:hypothetical protein
MDTQVQTQFTPASYLEFVVLEEVPPEKPAQYTAYDFGYEMDADEVGQAMATEYSNGSFALTPQIEPAEFEPLYYGFLS